MTETELETILKSIVKILGPKKDEVSGTGFIIREDGLIITCHHVIFNLDRLTVEYEGKKFEAEWCQEYSNPDKDVSILKIDADNTKPLQLIDPKDLRSLKTHIIICGFPHSTLDRNPKGTAFYPKELVKDAPTITLQTYNSTNPKYSNPWNRLPHEDADFNPFKINEKVWEGASGGPVFIDTLDGAIGMVQSIEGEHTYAVRWDNIYESLKKMGIRPKYAVSINGDEATEEQKEPINRLIALASILSKKAQMLVEREILDYIINVFSVINQETAACLTHGALLSSKDQKVAEQRLREIRAENITKNIMLNNNECGAVFKPIIEYWVIQIKMHIRSITSKSWRETRAYFEKTIFKDASYSWLNRDKPNGFGGFFLTDHERHTKDDLYRYHQDPLFLYSYNSDGFFSSVQMIGVWAGKKVREEILRLMIDTTIDKTRIEELHEYLLTELRVKDKEEELNHGKPGLDQARELLLRFLLGKIRNEDDWSRHFKDTFSNPLLY